jgi:hypothetical protein
MIGRTIKNKVFEVIEPASGASRISGDRYAKISLAELS